MDYGERKIGRSGLASENILNPGTHLRFGLNIPIQHIPPDIFISACNCQIRDMCLGKRFKPDNPAR
jgi:hypothetical protein